MLSPGQGGLLCFASVPISKLWTQTKYCNTN